MSETQGMPPDVELLTVGVRQYYIQREFTHVLVINVYVPPNANAKDAANAISSHVLDLVTSPRCINFLIIVFINYKNCHANLDSVLFHNSGGVYVPCIYTRAR